MITKRFITFFLIIMLTVNTASAAGITLNRWVLNVELLDDGTVEEIIQTEIENAGTSPLNGFSFKVPASSVTAPNISTFSAIGQKIDLQAVQGGTGITINFNSPLEPGKKWNGRIDFRAQNWAVKSGQDYSINIPVEAPEAIIAGKTEKMQLGAEPEIRSQVFLPRSVEPTSVEPSMDAVSRKPIYNKLLQFNHIVLTWFKLNLGDVISVKATYSGDLNKILESSGKLDALSENIKNAKAQGKDVLAAETHLSNARDYRNQALEQFWKKEDVSSAINAENNEIKLAEESLSVKVEPTETKKTPGFGFYALISIMLMIFALRKRK